MPLLCMELSATEGRSIKSPNCPEYRTFSCSCFSSAFDAVAVRPVVRAVHRYTHFGDVAVEVLF